MFSLVDFNTYRKKEWFAGKTIKNLDFYASLDSQVNKTTKWMGKNAKKPSFFEVLYLV